MLGNFSPSCWQPSTLNSFLWVGDDQSKAQYLQNTHSIWLKSGVEMWKECQFILAPFRVWGTRVTKPSGDTTRRCVSAAWWLAGASGRDATSMGNCRATPKEKRAVWVQFPSFSDPHATTVILVLVVKVLSFVLLKLSISMINKGVLSTLPI